MADDLGPILPEPGEEQTPADAYPTIPADVPPPDPPPPLGPDEDATATPPASTDMPPVDGLPSDDPLGAPGVGMDVPDQPNPANE